MSLNVIIFSPLRGFTTINLGNVCQLFFTLLILILDPEKKKLSKFALLRNRLSQLVHCRLLKIPIDHRGVLGQGRDQTPVYESVVALRPVSDL